MLRKLYSKIKKPKNFFFKKPKTNRDIDFELVKIDFAGNAFYVYKNFTDIPVTRHIASEIASNYASFNLTKDQLKKAFETIIDSYNNQKYHEGIAIVYELQQRLDFAASEYTLLQLACVFSLMNDENADAFISREQEAKLNAWSKDDEIKDFFLRTAYELIKPAESTLDQDIVDYLKEMELKTRNWITTLRLMK